MDEEIPGALWRRDQRRAREAATAVRRGLRSRGLLKLREGTDFNPRSFIMTSGTLVDPEVW